MNWCKSLAKKNKPFDFKQDLKFSHFLFLKPRERERERERERDMESFT